MKLDDLIKKLKQFDGSSELVLSVDGIEGQNEKISVGYCSGVVYINQESDKQLNNPATHDVKEGKDQFSLDKIRKDLVYQLNTPDELDWDYFVETAKRAKFKADETGVNMANGWLDKADF